MSRPGARLARALGAIALVAVVGTACSPSSDPSTGTLVITGSSTIAPVVAEIAQQVEREHPGVRIDVQSGGSSRGFGDVRSGLAHFGLDNREVQADVIAGENEQAIKTVAGSPDAIAYVSIGTAEVDIEHGVPIRLLAVGGVAARLANARSGAYPIARPLNLVTRNPAEGLARAFIDYVRSPAATAVFEAQSFVQVAE